jgi:hypothetical protein
MVPASVDVTGATAVTATLTAASTSSTTTGAYVIMLTATSAGITRTTTLNVTVNVATVSTPTITISPASLAAATVGTAYSATLTASGGTAPYRYAITSGAQPAGITLTGGVLAGMPTARGTFNFTVIATDSSAAPGRYSGTASYSLLVNVAAGTAPLDFTFTNTGASAFTVAPRAVAMYSFGLSPMNGTYASPVSFSVTGLPTGATASFTPSTVAVGGGATTVVMTVQTAAATAQNSHSPFGRGIVLALLLLPFGMKHSLRKKHIGKMLLFLLLLAGTTAAMSGCGSGSGLLLQSPQTYTLTVTATSGTFVHNQTVTLIVQ